MKRKLQKLVLNRETIRVLEDRSLSRVAGANTWWVCTGYGCTDYCDTDFDCSTGCDLPTDLWHACG